MSASHEPGPTGSTTDKERRRVVFAAVVGRTVEWYDHEAEQSVSPIRTMAKV
jgi:hypothetical protein